MSIQPDDRQQLTLVGKLLEDVPADLAAWRDVDNPNRGSAGRAALRSIDAAARALQTVRATLANDLYSFDQPEPASPTSTSMPATKWTPGNSGPGF